MDSPALRADGSLALARQQVAAVPVHDPAVRAFRDQVLDFIDAHPDALSRSCEEGHLTGSALVVDHAAERVLLILHRKLGRWLQPGGHADGDGDLARTALREATEETGLATLAVALPTPLDLDVHVVSSPKEAPHLHLDLRFLVVAPRGAAPEPNAESTAWAWVEPAELDRYGVDEAVRRMVGPGLDWARALRG